MPKVRVNKGRFKFHSLCSYLQLKELKNRALGMFSEGSRITKRKGRKEIALYKMIIDRSKVI